MGLMADGPYTTTGKGYSLTVTGESTDNLLGYETALYAVEPKPGRIGSVIVDRSADLYIQGKTERRSHPLTNYFRFAPDAGFYRIFYKAEQNRFTEFVIAAHTSAELDSETKTLQESGLSASCENLPKGNCVAIPKDTAVNPMISVTVNGSEELLPRGGTVFQAISISGERQPEAVLRNLKVHKFWNGRLVDVRFDRSDAAILKLVLTGGETISWRRE
jgi:hypothetical protein